MFQFPTFPSYTLLYSCMDKPASSWFEFPHSDIHGSMDICSLPWLFAAYHVLLRLLVPRYPPYALCSLTLNAFAFTVYFSDSFGLIVCILSYASLPFINLSIYFSMCFDRFLFNLSMVEIRRVELLTSCLQGRRSSQLSYIPIFNSQCTVSTLKDKQ